MSFKRVNGNKSSSKGKTAVGFSIADLDRLNLEVGAMNLDSNHNGGWEAISKKNKNRARNGSASASLTSKPNASGKAGTQRIGGRANGQLRAPNNVWAAQRGRRGGAGPPLQSRRGGAATSNPIPPPLQNGWSWNSRPEYVWQFTNDTRRTDNMTNPQPSVVEEDEEDVKYHDDLDASDDDDDLLDGEYDSDGILKSHEERKKSRRYDEFFNTLDTLTLDQIKEPTRQWHCPACQDGPGSIDWYSSLQSLVTHAKTKGSKRVKLHRDLAQVLEEELRRKGATLVVAGESYGQWKGLNEVVEDREIVWPPMVIIMNTQLEQDENEKWFGMGNRELLDYFGSYEARRARHCYGPKGHRGMSVLIFDSSAVGYTEAERLAKHFEQQGTDRDAWDHSRNLFYPGGKRQLHGYMATKGDMDIFNQHSKGKSKLKFELVSYQEKVVDQLKQMNEDNQQLHWYKAKISKEVMRSKALKESLHIATQKLRKNKEENSIVREKTMQFYHENNEEMDYQEQFFKEQLKKTMDHQEQLKVIHEAEEHRRVRQSVSSVEFKKREELLMEAKECLEERVMFMKLRDKKIAEMRSRHQKEEMEMIAEMRRRHQKEEIKLKEGFHAEFTQLMDKYAKS